MYITIITQLIKLIVVVVGDAIAAKWLAEFKYQINSLKDPILSDKINKEYQKIEASFQSQKENDKPV